MVVRLVSLGALLFFLLAGCDQASDDVETARTAEAVSPPTFVGSAACSGCHARETKAWTGSPHDLAIQVADGDSVLGDFSGVGFDYFGDSTRFVERDGAYVVETAGSDGKKSDFTVKYTFGVDPLQQYLVELPGGRLQALPFAWDTRPAEVGGQHWFHLHPDEKIEPGDQLFWTGADQNWNYMCAECHSTQVQLGYDAVHDTFDTTWKEIDVACEACHGPGSVHAAQAARKSFDEHFGLMVDLDDRDGATWQMNPETGIAQRSKPRTAAQRQPEACGRCHSRRGVIAPEYEFGKPLADTHLPALLDEPLYFADGQIHDEVYVYGSFLQSRMYRAGVSCSDCHEPHSLKLRTGDDVNAVCAQCHLPAKFATEEHRRHAPEEAGCVDCHMVARTYMVVDDRRDHSFRIPRPDLTERNGTPNACNGCHTDQDAAWATAAVSKWYGDGVFARPEFATALAAGRAGYANTALREVVLSGDFPGIARATALSLFGQPISSDDLAVVQSAITDPDPLMRTAAYHVLRDLPGDVRARYGFGGLADPVRAVRMEAALTFAGLHDLLPADAARNFRRAVADYRASYEYTSNRAESLAHLGDLELAMGNHDEALLRYRQALGRDPTSLVARVNLADIYRAGGDETEAERLLRAGLDIEPDSASLRYALGLLLARTSRAGESLAELRRAARLDPDEARYAYVLGVALNSFGSTGEAIAELEAAYRRFPGSFDIGWGLATMYRDHGDTARALAISEELLERYPDQAQVVALRRSLESS